MFNASELLELANDKDINNSLIVVKYCEECIDLDEKSEKAMCVSMAESAMLISEKVDNLILGRSNNVAESNKTKN